MGNTYSGKRQPKACTFTTATRHQASNSPSGIASNTVKLLSMSVCPRLSQTSCMRRTPSAHSGANWPSRAWPRVSRLMNNATPATPRVRLLRAAVAAKVRLKTSVDQRFRRACSTTRLSSRAKCCCSAALSTGTRSALRSTLKPARVACGQWARNQPALTSTCPLGLP
ncbi:hypothetical protein D3C78_1342760 [compost metagenome]